MTALRVTSHTRKVITHTLLLCPFQNAGGDAVSGTTHRRSAVDIPLGEDVRSVLFMASYALLFYMPPHDLCLRTKVVYHLSCCFAVVLTTNQEKHIFSAWLQCGISWIHIHRLHTKKTVRQTIPVML